ncbi:hypothetical protein PR202_ga15811 [Eleusine coracana subsp. coracana]|uniref:Ionotropic glutamate receptor C-terminal domain-containing protein n=1 Tax=Eleusine coracana subsp. coracana TaxID=191504 RepID=A0AAV5CKV3_ELECO|nr:hypothetical protein PR202_ga15811 [Eleusine coracana subsp. coracana]
MDRLDIIRPPRNIIVSVLVLVSSWSWLLFVGHEQPRLSQAQRQQSTPSSVLQVGALLDLGTAGGRATRAVISLALEDFYASQPGSSMTVALHVADCKNDEISATAADIAARLFVLAHDAGMLASGYAWIVTDSVGNMFNTLDQTTINSMHGVLGVRPYVPPSDKLLNFPVRFVSRYRQQNPALRKVAPLTLGFQMPPSQNSNSSNDLTMLGVSQDGPGLIDAIRATRFQGISVIWPGGSTQPPRGWVWPVAGKKLQIAVPMVVPMKENWNKSLWVFLKPIDPVLWAAILVVFLVTGFAIWIVERKESRYFRGNPGKQLVNVAYFSFQAILAVPRDPKLKEWLSKFALINFVLLVWLLEKLYSASLTSMMTVRQLQPTVADLNQLIANGDYVGYQVGSFVNDLLKSLNVDDSKIRSYRTDQYAEALMKGSWNGGVAAIFDEIPYLKLFMSKNCRNHSVVGRVYKTGGFGFVFPKGSPLVADVSRAILKVTEGDEIVGIDRKWFGDEVVCTNKGNGIESESIVTWESLRGVFYITIGLWTIAGIIYAVMYLRRGREEPVERPVAELAVEHVQNDDIDESVNWPISRDTHLIIRLRGNPSRRLQPAAAGVVEQPAVNGGGPQ